MDRAERMVLLAVLLVIFGVFFVVAYPILGVLWIVFFAVPAVVYGTYSARQSQNKRALPFRARVTPRRGKQHRPAHEMYQDLLTEFARSFGVARGSMMLESQIKGYMKHGLNREEAIRKFAQDEGY